MDFPRWIYHKEKDAKIVYSKEDYEKCGIEWANKPFCEGEYNHQPSKVSEEQKEEPKKRTRQPKAKA